MTQSFPWYKSYPAGVPHEINPDRYPSIPAVLDDIAARYPDKVGYTNMDCGLTYSRTAALTKELAAYLQSLGLKPGDRVAIMMPNLLQYVIAMYACLRAGYIVVNINPLYTSREVNGTLRDSEAKAIIIIENFAKQGDCVIVGRAADVILKDYDPLNIFVYADKDSKIERCQRRAPQGEHLTPREIESHMKQIDRNRAQHHQMYSDNKWGDKGSYDLCVNTTKRFVKDLVPAIAKFCEDWFNSHG